MKTFLVKKLMKNITRCLYRGSLIKIEFIRYEASIIKIYVILISIRTELSKNNYEK